jgi:hypothetical protein
VFGHPSRTPPAEHAKVAGKQVLSNGPSSLAGAINPTAVPERSLGMRAPDARHFAEGAARMIA